MDIFGAAHESGGAGRGGKKILLPKIQDAYPTMMKLGTVIPYLKKIQKMYESRDTPFSSGDVSVFSLEISNFYCNKKSF